MAFSRSFPRPISSRPRCFNARQGLGFTLIEVLITLVLLSIGFLGMLGMQSFSLQQSHHSYFSTQATLLVKDLSDRMRTNVRGVDGGFYEQALIEAADFPVVTSCISAGTCNPAEQAQSDLASWSLQAKLLPSAKIRVAQSAGIDAHEIFISWEEKKSGVDRNSAIHADGDTRLCHEAGEPERSCVVLVVWI
jgi:type IV pilus assembly protein PilV